MSVFGLTPSILPMSSLKLISKLAKGDRLSIDGMRGGRKIRYRILVDSDPSEDHCIVMYGTVGGSIKRFARLYEREGYYEMSILCKDGLKHIFTNGIQV